MPLVLSADSVLIVVDVQEGFCEGITCGERERAAVALARMTWRAKVARRLGVSPGRFAQRRRGALAGADRQ